MKIIKECKTKMVEESSCETSYKFCCKQMKQVFDKNWYSSYDDGSGEWDNAFIIVEGELKIPIRMSGSYGDRDVVMRLPIKCCPFCGEEIKYEKISNTEDEIANDTEIEITLDEKKSVDTGRWGLPPRKKKHWWW